MKHNKLTIGQLAHYAHVTVRAVRHYHEIGLLPEPVRDSSGYRRYDAQAVIRLIQIKTLAEAGVPLAQISNVLHADVTTFGETIQHLKTDITKRITKLQQTKKQLGQLQAGEALYAPQYIVKYLEQMRALGISEELIGLERDGWILLAAVSPDQIPALLVQKSAILQNPQVAQLYKLYDQARTWNASDPRLEPLARKVIAVATALQNQGKAHDRADIHALSEKRVQSLLSSYDISPFPAWKRLEEIIESTSK